MFRKMTAANIRAKLSRYPQPLATLRNKPFGSTFSVMENIIRPHTFAFVNQYYFPLRNYYAITDKPIAPPRKASADIAFGYVHGMVNLTCEAEAEPAANFTWYRHGKKLSHKVHLIHSEGHVSYLQVYGVQIFIIKPSRIFE